MPPSSAFRRMRAPLEKIMSCIQPAIMARPYVDDSVSIRIPASLTSNLLEGIPRPLAAYVEIVGSAGSFSSSVLFHAIIFGPSRSAVLWYSCPFEDVIQLRVQWKLLVVSVRQYAVQLPSARRPISVQYVHRHGQMSLIDSPEGPDMSNSV